MLPGCPRGQTYRAFIDSPASLRQAFPSVLRCSGRVGRVLARLGARSNVGVRFGVRDDTLLWKNLGAEAL